MAALARLKRIWRYNNTSFTSNFKLYKSLATAILLYCCKTWTLLADSEKKIQAFETECLRKLLRISSVDHKTIDWVRGKISFLVGPQEPLLATVRRRKFAQFGMSHSMTASPKPFFRAPLRVGDTVVGRRNTGWTT